MKSRRALTGSDRRAAALYRALLAAYPREFRDAYGDDAVRAFTQLHRDAVGLGPGFVIGLWVRTAASVVSSGLRERADRRREALAGVGGLAALPRGWRAGDTARHAQIVLRSLVRRPGFALATIALIGLGIGATTMIFSIVYSVLLRPLPYPASQRLVVLQKAESNVPVPDFVDLRAQATSFDGVGAAMRTTMDLTGDGEPLRLSGSAVSADVFGLLGARAYRGRLFTAAEYGPDAPAVAVVTFGLWTRRWGGDDAVIGRSIRLDGRPVTVVGVLDPTWSPSVALGVESSDVFTPLDVTEPTVQDRRMFLLGVIGRLREGVSPEAARAELSALSTHFVEDHPDSWSERDGTVYSWDSMGLKEATVGDIGRPLWMLLGAVALMLLIACANVANLFLARSTDRVQEMAVRSALGASRRRLIAQLLVECLMLSLAGGALGLLLAFAGVRAFRALDPGRFPRVGEIAVDARVLLFAVLLSTLTGLVFGLVPAFSAARANAGAALRESGLATTPGRARSRVRSGLIISQLALSLVLLCGAGLLFRSFVRLRSVDTGFDPDGLLTIQLNVGTRVPPSGHAAFVSRIEERLSSLPRVRAVGTSWRLPFDRGRCCWSSRLIESVERDTIDAYIHPVTAGYFGALGARVVEGRLLEERDRPGGTIDDGPHPAGSPPGPDVPVVVNRRLAERLWPDASPIGRTLEGSGQFHVVGVIEPILHWRLDADPGYDVYVPYQTAAEWRIGLLDIGIRHDGPAGPLANSVRDIVHEIDPDLPIDRVIPMDARISESIATPRFYAILLGTFATLAFVLAAGGVYGSMLYVAGMRRREMGIRVALGAETTDVVGLFVRQGAILIAAGASLGFAVTIGVSRVLNNLVFGITVTDPLTIIGATILLALVAMAACWTPARQAARADPVATLRSG